MLRFEWITENKREEYINTCIYESIEQYIYINIYDRGDKI